MVIVPGSIPKILIALPSLGYLLLRPFVKNSLKGVSFGTYSSFLRGSHKLNTQGIGGVVAKLD